MSTFFYTVGDEYPDMTGTLAWKGAVDTDNIQSLALIANGLESGAWTGPVQDTGGVSNDPNKSTKTWRFDVKAADNALPTGVDALSYELCMKVIHASGSQETVKLNTTVRVEAC